MINQMDSLRQRMALELIRRKMEKKEIKPITKTENGGTGGIDEQPTKKDGKYI